MPYVPVDYAPLKHIHQTEHDQLPSYTCHKIVRAAKITAKEADPDFGGLRLIFGDIGLWVRVENEWCKRNGPIHVGGYYVVYEDGYRSFSPKKAFENGYSLTPICKDKDEAIESDAQAPTDKEEDR